MNEPLETPQKIYCKGTDEYYILALVGYAEETKQYLYQALTDGMLFRLWSKPLTVEEVFTASREGRIEFLEEEDDS